MVAKLVLDQLEKTGGSLTALTLPAVNATADQYLKNDGAGVLGWVDAPADVSGLNSVIVYTGSAIWTKSARPAGITKVIVEVVGAGGSGSAQVTNYGAGAAGGVAKKLVDVSSVTASTVTVGLGGAGLGAGGGVGNAGGLSSWADAINTDVVGNGGAGRGGSGDSSGGTATGGDINITGGKGYTGAGGGIVYGSAGAQSSALGQGYGSGGGAGYSTVASGAGAPGIVIVWEYK